jgi:Rod binding domain-containing protein
MTTPHLIPATSSAARVGELAAAPAQVKRAAEEFEAVFLAQMLRGLTSGLSGKGMLGDQDDPFATMLQDEYARLISRTGGIGLADAVLREMLTMQEAA